MFLVNLSINFFEIYGISNQLIYHREGLINIEFIDILRIIMYIFTICCTSIILLINFFMRKEIFDTLIKIEIIDFEVKVIKIIA